MSGHHRSVARTVVYLNSLWFADLRRIDIPMNGTNDTLLSDLVDGVHFGERWPTDTDLVDSVTLAESVVGPAVDSGLAWLVKS